MTTLTRASALVLVLALSGCATLFRQTNHTPDRPLRHASELRLLSAPDGLEVYENGQRLPLITHTRYRDQASGTSQTVRTPSVWLDHRRPHTLTLVHGERRAEVTIRPRAETPWVVMNLFTGGWLVDWPTKAWNGFPSVDVPAVLAAR